MIKLFKKKPDFKLINPFVPELPVTTCADSHPFYCLWRHQFWLSRITLSTNLCRVKRSIFQTIPEWAQFRCQGHQRKRHKNRVTLTWNFPWKSCFTTHLPFLSSNPKIRKAFLKTFRNKMKHTIIMPSKRKKNEARKAKKEGRRESEKLACEQALLFGQAKRASWECASQGPRKGELATISYKFSFPPWKPRDSAKRENCHCKRAAD